MRSYLTVAGNTTEPGSYSVISKGCMCEICGGRVLVSSVERIASHLTNRNFVV